MDWITGIQRAVNYIENNLDNNIDYEISTTKKRQMKPPAQYFIFKEFSVFFAE